MGGSCRQERGEKLNRVASINMVRVKLSELNPAKYNPRKRLIPGEKDYEDLKNSLDDFSYVDPIIINKDKTIIGGHQRFYILLDEGYTEADVSLVDLSEYEEKSLNVILNKARGKWDRPKLMVLLQDIQLNGLGIESTGFTQNELNDLIEEIVIPETVEDDNFDAQEEYETIETPRTKRGDIYILGNHRLMCGDSTIQEDVDALMNGEQADLVVTDPPYNVNYGDKAQYLEDYLGKGHRNQSEIKNDNMDAVSFYHFLFDAFSQAYRVMREGAAIYVFHGENEGITFRTAFRDAGLKQSQCLIWEKNSFVLGRQDYQWKHEPILYGWKEDAAHYFVDDRTQDTVILTDDEIDYKHMKKQELIAYVDELHRSLKDKTTVIYENKPTRNDVHPTMKPTTLVGKFIKNSSQVGWRVVDLFGGSGSTLMAAEQLQRRAFIMELDEKFCDVIVHRWEEYTGGKAVKI